MKVETIALTVLAPCIFLSFYFTYVSLQTVEEVFKKQLVFLAASSLIAGVAILACMVIYLGMKKTFSPVGGQLTDSEKESTEDDNA